MRKSRLEFQIGQVVILTDIQIERSTKKLHKRSRAQRQSTAELINSRGIHNSETR
jgi:hypothetical protein